MEPSVVCPPWNTPHPAVACGLFGAFGLNGCWMGGAATPLPAPTVRYTAPSPTREPVMDDFTCAQRALARCRATSSPYVALSSLQKELARVNSASDRAVIITSRVFAYFDPGRSAASTIHAAPRARSCPTPAP